METISTTEDQLYQEVVKIPLIQLLKEKAETPKGKTHVITTITNNNILAFCSKGYKLRQNTTIFQPFEKLLNQKYTIDKKQIRVLEGTKFYVDYVLKHKLKSTSIIDILPRISIWNSYDGTVKTQIKFGYFKLLCGNELSRPVNCTINLAKKHSKEDGEFSTKTIPHYMELLDEFIDETVSDIAMFERLHSKPSNIDFLKDTADNLRLNKIAREVAVKQLEKETKGGFTYTNEKGKVVKSKKNPITLFTIYNALNYAIYNTNPKELPDFKYKKDIKLLDSICKSMSKCKV